jgi:hypothetical protein
MDKNNEKNEHFKKVSIEDEDGLKISYDKEELDEFFPHLIKEISGNQKSIKIDSVEMEIESYCDNNSKESDHSYPEELINPSTIDFIRRCTTNEDAINILDYMLKRKKISKIEYKSLRSQILEEDGLKELINKHGGFKSPGYYEKKYRNLMRERPKEEE